MKAKSNSVILSAAISLNFFWVLNVFKEAYKSVKNFLNFYPPTGPLLGLFIASLVVFALSVITLPLILSDRLGTKSAQKFAIWLYTVSVVLFFFMVFPPVSEPLVEMLSGK